MGKHVKYYCYEENGEMKFVKLESELIFSVAEGMNHLKELHPDAKNIKHTPKAPWAKNQNNDTKERPSES